MQNKIKFVFAFFILKTLKIIYHFIDIRINIQYIVKFFFIIWIYISKHL